MTNFIFTAVTAAMLTAGVGTASLAKEADSSLTSAAVATPEHTKTGKRGKRADGERKSRLDRFCERAACTPDQKAQLQGIMQSHREDTKADREKMRERKKAVQREFVSDRPDQRALKRDYREIDGLRDHLTKERREMMMEIHGVLTPAQRQLASKMLVGGKGKDHGKGRAKHMGKDKDEDKGKAHRQGHAKGKGKGHAKGKGKGHRQPPAQ